MDDLQKLVGRKIRGVTLELTQWGYTLMLVTDKGRTFYFTSESEIELEVEQEQ